MAIAILVEWLLRGVFEFNTSPKNVFGCLSSWAFAKPPGGGLHACFTRMKFAFCLSSSNSRIQRHFLKGLGEMLWGAIGRRAEEVVLNLSVHPFDYGPISLKIPRQAQAPP